MTEREDDKRIQTYVSILRRQSRRYAEHLWSELEKLRALCASLDKEYKFLSDQNRGLKVELETAHQTRVECARLASENERLTGDIRRANELIEFYSKERGDLRVRLTETEEESCRYAAQYFDVEQQNTQLANFYVTIHQLHATLEHEDVINGIKEIVINLIGSEEVAIFERSDDYLLLAGSFGIDEAKFRAWPVSSNSLIGAAVSSNEIFVREGRTLHPGDEEHLTACVPLRVAGDVIGAIAIFRLLQHKPALEPCDRELFELLATHAGMALYTTTLHAARTVAVEVA